MSVSEETPKKANILPTKSHDSDDNDNNASSDTSSVSNYDSDNNEIQKENPDAEDVDAASAFTLRMLKVCQELAIFALIVVTYAALTNDPPKITRSPAAYPFFPKDSIVTDWYRGQVSKAIEHSRSSDIAFVMFYAPWDAESQTARKEVELAAKYMHRFVHFSAVNCWQPRSDCRNQYNKVYRWPILIAYPTHGQGIQYHGPISAPHIIKFLQKVCWPITRVGGDKFREYEDAFVVANVNALPGSLEYAVYYSTALKFLEKDPFQSISFYANVQKNETPALFLHLWNETLMYPIHEREWRPDSIVKWLFSHLHQVTAWVAPNGLKSLALSGAIEPGPSLILFTPKNPLHPFNDYYNMLQEVGQEYYNCQKDYIMDSMHTVSKRYLNTLRFQQLLRSCPFKSEQQPVINTIHMKPKTWNNNTKCNCNNGPNLLENKITFSQSFKSDESIDINTPYVNNKECDTFKIPSEDASVYKTSMFIGHNDPRSPENLAKLFEKEKCRQFVTAQKFEPILFDETFYRDENGFNITGLACETNHSLALVAMNSLIHYHFAERLGIDLSKRYHKSAAVIINEKMETHHILNKNPTGQSLRKFIYNFTKNYLPRALKSSTSVKSEKTHDYLKNNQVYVKNNTVFSLKELNTKSFLPTILKKNKAIVVFYYSKQCSFCNGVSYTFLTTAKKLSSIEDIEFARIDGDLNVLPWEYTMENYPTILFFPAERKSESRAFPKSLPITVSNLLGFVLTNLDPPLRLQAMWHICSQTQFEDDKLSCMSSVRIETLSLIEKILKQWRIVSEREKPVMLYRLKQLKQLHLLFAHSPQEVALIQSYFNKLISKPNLKNSNDKIKHIQHDEL